MSTGKLIVIDGIDGSGKATQTKLLAKHLQKAGHKVKTIDFPRYYDNFFGALLGEYLSGRHGDFIQVDPRLASILYAADRFESSGEISRWLKQGYVVLADRYVSSNQIHQGGKIKKLKPRKDFLNWLDKMEFGVFGIPKPDLVIYLDVPFLISKKWLENKVAQRSKKYLQGRKDVAEDNLSHLKDSRLSALMLAKSNKNWSKVECCHGQTCLSPEQVSEVLLKLVQKKFRF